MAYYDERPYYPPTRDRPSRPGHSQDYYYGNHPSHMDMVPRYDRSDESIEEIPRDYPPGDYAYDYPPPRHQRVATVQEGVRRSHSMSGGRGGPYYDDSDYYYRPSRGRRSKHHDDRYGHYKYSRSPSTSRSPPRRRRKSLSEQALSALGLGSAASSGSRHRDERSRSRGRRNHHGRSYSYSPSPTRHHRRARSEQRIAQAVKAAVTAGAVEAFRLRKDKGEWTGEKGKRILTAALTAGGTDGLVDRDPSKHSKRHIIESTLAGLAANHFVNGPRSRSRSKGGRHHRSRSRVHDIAATGALAAAGKEAWNRYSRSRSRPRRGRSLSRDGSYDGRRQRSRSVSDYISRGLEALGLDSSKDKARERERDDPHRRHRHRSSRYGGPDDGDSYYYSDDDDWDSEYGRGRHGASRRTRHSRDVGRPLASTTNPSSSSGSSSSSTHTARPQEHASDADNSTDEDRRHRKLTRDTLVASGLATVATIHAAHGLHESMEKHKRTAQMLREGDISPDEARRRRLKGNLSDVASVGLAALGVKGAVAQWKHANEKRRERASFMRERSLRRERRGDPTLLPRRASSHGPPGRTMYPDEIEENYSSPPRGRRESVF
ncbi:hypothetical protein BDV59DRAFT_18689 [Aspergillus ambiguus]|uniref:uncharacterized protein n=1 Tax=Aspergillus ambiguus TaxID=176160 RepID=UPI003CCD77B4